MIKNDIRQTSVIETIRYAIQVTYILKIYFMRFSFLNFIFFIKLNFYYFKNLDVYDICIYEFCSIFYSENTDLSTHGKSHYIITGNNKTDACTRVNGMLSHGNMLTRNISINSTLAYKIQKVIRDKSLALCSHNYRKKKNGHPPLLSYSRNEFLSLSFSERRQTRSTFRKKTLTLKRSAR